MRRDGINSAELDHDIGAADRASVGDAIFDSYVESERGSVQLLAFDETVIMSVL
jgi:hypothetical protein